MYTSSLVFRQELLSYIRRFFKDSPVYQIQVRCEVVTVEVIKKPGEVFFKEHLKRCKVLQHLIKKETQNSNLGMCENPLKQSTPKLNSMDVNKLLFVLQNNCRVPQFKIFKAKKKRCCRLGLF